MSGDPGAPSPSAAPPEESAQPTSPPETSPPAKEPDDLLNLSALRRRVRELDLQLSPGAVEVLERWVAESLDGAALAVRTGGRKRVTATFMRRVLFK